MNANTKGCLRLWSSLASIALGGMLAIAGTLVGAVWQAREARRVRAEQYARDDQLRDLEQRRSVYARFACVVDEIEDAKYNESEAFYDFDKAEGDAAQAEAKAYKNEMISRAMSKHLQLYPLLWELELIAPSAVVLAARTVYDELGELSGFDLPESIRKAKLAFIAAARVDLGLPHLPPIKP